MKKEIITTFITRLGVSLLGMLTAILLARMLGPEGRGEYFLAMTIVATVQQFGTLGLHSSNTFRVAADNSLLWPLASNSCWISLLVGIISLPVICGILPRFFTTLDAITTVLVALAIVPTLYYLFSSNLLLGINRISAFNKLELLNRILPLALILFMLPFGQLTAQLALLINVVSMMVICILATGRMAESRPLLRFNPALFAGGLSYGFRAYVCCVLGFLISRAGVLMLDDAVQRGYLSVALQLADFMQMLPATIAMLLFPRLVGDKTDRARTTIRMVNITALLMSLACLAAWLLAEMVIPLLFGDAFKESVAVFRVLLPGTFALGVIAILSQYLAAHGIPWVLIFVWACGLVTMIISCTLFIPGYGAWGVALAMSISCCVVCVVLIFLSVKFNAH